MRALLVKTKNIILYIRLPLYHFPLLFHIPSLIFKVQECQNRILKLNLIIVKELRKSLIQVLTNPSPIMASIVLDHFTLIMGTEHFKN